MLSFVVHGCAARILFAICLICALFVFDNYLQPIVNIALICYMVACVVRVAICLICVAICVV